MNFSTCIVDAAPAAPLIHANEWRTFSSGIHGECFLMWMPMSPCSYRIGSCPSVKHRVPEPRLQPVPARASASRSRSGMFSSYISSIAPRPWRSIAPRAPGRAGTPARAPSRCLLPFEARVSERFLHVPPSIRCDRTRAGSRRASRHLIDDPENASSSTRPFVSSERPLTSSRIVCICSVVAVRPSRSRFAADRVEPGALAEDQHRGGCPTSSGRYGNDSMSSSPTLRTHVVMMPGLDVVEPLADHRPVRGLGDAGQLHHQLGDARRTARS